MYSKNDEILSINKFIDCTDWHSDHRISKSMLFILTLQYHLLGIFLIINRILSSLLVDIKSNQCGEGSLIKEGDTKSFGSVILILSGGVRQMSDNGMTFSQ
jgi:hypothetical protein